MLREKVRSLFHAELYHGWGKTRRYFEGWYYKIVSADEDHALAFIPGIAMNEEGQRQAFIQVLDGKKKTAVYHQFPADEFVPSERKFTIRIGDNLFGAHSIDLKLPDATGHLKFSQPVRWPNPWYSPNIMGPFSFVPLMQCYHGILSMDHLITGQLNVNGRNINFDGGRGYTEKDWGRSFPSAYFWMQSNHFSEPGISLKASVARIPWLGSSFVGFIAGVWLRDRLIEFTTYNFTRLRRAWADHERVELVMENRRYRLEILAHRDATTALASPILGFMDGRVEESMAARLDVLVTDKKHKTILLEDTGRNAGLEAAGKIEEITI